MRGAVQYGHAKGLWPSIGIKASDISNTIFAHRPLDILTQAYKHQKAIDRFKPSCQDKLSR